MKAFKLTMMAAMLAFAGTAMAQEKVVISAGDVALDENGNGVIEVVMSYPTSETIVGYNFSLVLDNDNVKGVNAKTGKVTGTGKVTAASVALNTEIHPLVWDADDEDYTKDPKEALTVENKTDGSVLVVWIDQKKKTPLVATEGNLMTIKIQATDPNYSGEGKFTGVGVSNDKNESLDLGNIAEVTFAIVGGGTDGINDIQAAGNDAPAYNLQGIRVNNAKGLIIRDGKKMVVK